jgi:hypothetical protein
MQLIRKPSPAVQGNKKSAPKKSKRFGEENGLLGAEDRVFRGLGDAELHDAFGFDLDLFAGLRIAADAGGAVFQNKLADARQRESVFRVFVSE